MPDEPRKGYWSAVNEIVWADLKGKAADHTWRLITILVAGGVGIAAAILSGGDSRSDDAVHGVILAVISLIIVIALRVLWVGFNAPRLMYQQQQAELKAAEAEITEGTRIKESRIYQPTQDEVAGVLRRHRDYEEDQARRSRLYKTVVYALAAFVIAAVGGGALMIKDWVQHGFGFFILYEDIPYAIAAVAAVVLIPTVLFITVARYK